MFKVTACEYLASFGSLTTLPTNGFPEIAFAGRSNVGKSSLINTLLGRRRLAKTSSTPGKTRTLNYYLVNGSFYFVDLPGYGYAKVSKQQRHRWQTLVEPYLRERPVLCGVVQLMDIRHQPTEGDRNLLDWLDFYQIPALVVLTKADKLSPSRAKSALLKARQMLNLDEERSIIFSAKTAQGKDLIWPWVADRIHT
jgi:GTP-binding protein